MTEIIKEAKKPKPFFNPNPHAYAPEMKEHDQWIFSQFKMNPDGTWSKPPCNASGYYTDGTDENNWLSFEKAFETCKAHQDKLCGIGFCISSACKIKGIDYDHIYDPITGEWNQQAWEELISLGSRVEWSPSHTGVHVYFKCPIELENGKKTQPDGTGREMYFGKLYLTVTGEVVEGFPTTINEVDPELVMQLYNKWFPDKKEAPVKADTKTAGKDNILQFDIPKSVVNRPDCPLKDLFPTKDQVMVLCRNAPNGLGEKFDRLFKGNISGYTDEKGEPDESRADLAIAGMIAFHTSDYFIIKQIIQESALWDKKWERNEYCQRTIVKAIRNRRR